MRVFITIDTEFAAGFAHLGRAENFRRTIACDGDGGPVGIHYQMEVMERCGLTGVFFVDPMPALLWGVEAIADVVGPIAARGHDVQLHVHTEWLALADQPRLVGGRRGGNLKDFAFQDQCAILNYARGVLIAAGAPQPVAFRAGNYGANDDTLRALAHLGFTHDTSHSPAITDGACAISLDSDDRHPVTHCGVTEVPIGCIDNFGTSLRHGQITALSLNELVAALEHASGEGAETFTLVSHSFELMCRRRLRANRIVKRRFERLCEAIAAMPGVETGTYTAHPPAPRRRDAPRAILPLDPMRSGMRMIEQAMANTIYDSAWPTRAKRAAALGLIVPL